MISKGKVSLEIDTLFLDKETYKLELELSASLVNQTGRNILIRHGSYEIQKRDGIFNGKEGLICDRKYEKLVKIASNERLDFKQIW